ncbi:MAG: DUF1295 domain-containing protein [Deltaproteobacteria bacterium]|nr:DUF1295 domain-containing protein [Deltaproteobacteria bacterium]
MIDTLIGFFAPWVIYFVLLLMHLLVPARHVEGYVLSVETGKPLHYRLNGLLVFILSMGAWALAGYYDIISYAVFCLHKRSGLLGACTIGLIASFAIVIGAKKVRSNFLANLFFGRLVNPQFFNNRVDAKMFLYLAGATLLGLNILSFAAHNVILFKHDYSPSVVLYTALFFWFLIDYMTFERVHLYTYDLFAERVGYKLTWGCLTFYPYFYAVGIFAVASMPNPQMPVWWMVLSAIVFFTGWSFARGANMQKFFFKTDPQKSFLGIFKPVVVTDNKHTLLCSGFWGISRHVNYLGEILMATGLTMALGYPLVLWGWLYPLYYVALLFTRERDDDKRCQEKYGPLWDEYKSKVKRRIIPFIY